MSETRRNRLGRVLTRAAATVTTLAEDLRRPVGSALILHLVSGDDALFRQQRRCVVALEGAGAVAPSPLALMTTPRPWPAAAPLVVPLLVDASERVTERWLSVLEELGWGVVVLTNDASAARRRWGGAGALVGVSEGAGEAAWCLDTAECAAAVRVSLTTGWAPPEGVCSVVALNEAVTPSKVVCLVSPEDGVAAKGMAVLRAGSLTNRALRLANRVAARRSGR